MCVCGRDPKEEEEGRVEREEGTDVHLGNLLQSEGGVAVAGPVQIVPVRNGAVRSPGPSAPPAAGLPAQGPGGVTSRGHVAAAAAGSGRAWALGSRGRCWPPGTPAPGDRPAAAAHTAGAAGAAAVAAAGDSDPAPSIATLRVGPEVSAAAAAHIQLAGGREPALPGRASRSPSPSRRPRPAPRPLHGRRRAQTPATRAGFLGARCRRRDGARRVSAMPGRGSRCSHCSRCCCFCCCCWWWWWCCGWGWRWRLLKRLLVLGLLGSRWLLGPGLCFLVLLTNPLDHSAPAPRASLAPGTWGLRSVCVQRAAAAAAP